MAPTEFLKSTALDMALKPKDDSFGPAAVARGGGGGREEIRAYQTPASALVARYDGFVAKSMGEGVLVYFGYPRAHEDDAERAVRAGLSVVGAVGRLDVSFVKLQARIGIATGSAQEQSVVGAFADQITD